jgi:hypothetical protein
MQSTARYVKIRYFVEVSHFTQDLFPFLTKASVQYEPCNLFTNICKVLFRDFHVDESKYMVGRGDDLIDISAVRVIWLIGLAVDGLHISLKDYNCISAAINNI